MGDAQVEDIKGRINIVDIVSEYLPLKKAGANFKAPCPFHNEKTPSFMVSDEKQIWHCFGCGQGGDVLTFIQQIEGIEFYDALKMLAQKAGVELKTGQRPVASQKGRLLDLLDDTAEFYHRLFLEHPKATYAREYIKQRGLNDETIATYKIGYSPDAWQIASEFLKKKGYSDNELQSAGLTVQRNDKNGYYDRFRNRLMFPITNSFGATVGFSARILDEEKDKMGKYINSPQSEVYNKSQVLYGLPNAKLTIKQTDSVIVVEGQMDVITAWQAGTKNIVASSGTALTVEQVKAIKRFTTNVSLCFDSDKAGEQAAERGVEIALQNGLNVKYIVLPDGKDPDDCIKADLKTWQTAVEKALPIIEYFINKAMDKNIYTDARLRGEEVRKILGFILKIENKIEQDYYFRLLAQRLDVPNNVILQEVREITGQSFNPPRRIFTKPVTVMKVNKNRDSLADRLLSIVIGNIKKSDNYLNNDFFEYIENVEIKNLIIKILKVSDKYDSVLDLVNNVFKDFSEEENKLITVTSLKFDTYYSDFNQASLSEEFTKLSYRLKEQSLNKKMKEVQRDLLQAENIDDEVAISEIMDSLNNIKEEITTLNQDLEK